MLSSLKIENAKPRDEPYVLTDGNGLHLLITAGGSRLWRLRYRFGGKQNMLSLGAFPEVSLASARAKRDDARKLVADGKDAPRALCYSLHHYPRHTRSRPCLQQHSLRKSAERWLQMRRGT